MVKKFQDDNGNGYEESNEKGLANVKFTVCGPNAATPAPSPALSSPCFELITGPNGTASKDGLDPGNYTVTEQVPDGFVPTTATSQNVTITLNDTSVVKFGNRPVCIPSPSPSPSSTPSMTPAPSASPTPTPEICVSPTPGPKGSASPIVVTATPGVTEKKGQPQPPAGSLPRTGAAEALLLSLFAIAASLYLYLRERRATEAAKNAYKLTK